MALHVSILNSPTEFFNVLISSAFGGFWNISFQSVRSNLLGAIWKYEI